MSDWDKLSWFILNLLYKKFKATTLHYKYDGTHHFYIEGYWYMYLSNWLRMPSMFDCAVECVCCGCTCGECGCSCF